MIQSVEEPGVFLDNCQAQFDFTEHTLEDCDGKCWKSVDIIDMKRLGNSSRERLKLKDEALSSLRSSRRCFSADELIRAGEMGIITSNGCRKIKRESDKSKEICFCSDQDMFRLYGPGLEASFQVPVRYFYLQAYDSKGQKLNYSTQSSDRIEFHLTRVSDQLSVHSYRKVDDLNDGTYLFRYRLYESVKDLRIFIRFGKQDKVHVVNGYIYSDGCYCPESNLTQWLNSLQCSSSSLSQLHEDFKLFKQIDMIKVLNKAKEKYFQHPKTYALCHYVIKNNQIYRKCYGEHVAFQMFSDAVLLSLSRKVILPDVEFLMNLGDYPLSNNDNDPLPIISWCGSKQTHDIILPTYEITEATLQMLSRTTLDIFAMNTVRHLSWSKKIPKGFFRGRDSCQERLDLVRLSKKFPDLIDANLTRMFFFRDQMSEFEPFAEYIPMPKFFDYKYQISIDGTVASYRFPYLLAGDSLIFKQTSSYYEYFYRDLIPNKHYIPIKKDLSDLIEKIQWAKTHDDEAQEIVKHAQRFTQHNLLPNHILCYHVQVLQEYAKRLVSPVNVSSDMELVQHEKDESHIKKDNCICHHSEMSTNPSCGVRAPAIIYSCLLKNNSDAEVTIQIEFTGFEGHHHEIADIELAKGEEQLIDEKEFEHGEHNTKYRKGVDCIRVKKFDGTTIELKKPFDGVTSPKKKWIFEITNDSIKSIDPEKQ
ncbi:unnamed protein product [Adineta steineri]|uniref:Glycosyl transferase CAP10 domain-containing protein n=1 Tax=Adineta steineri TaxID=433720 RepID=A0A815D181_9BILA|nr:unnamed protein product [Adineta steineri]CAF3774019.1 unnamed protein product [Adineta steineri]